MIAIPIFTFGLKPSQNMAARWQCCHIASITPVNTGTVAILTLTRGILRSMKILYLSPYKRLTEFLEANGDEVVQSVEPLTDEMLEGIDFIISYGYRRKIAKEVTDRFKGKAINLHISYLPYNRGADPNLWSFLEDTPKGVTIHYLDGSIDTGDIIAREEVPFELKRDTLRNTYKRLSDTIEALFCRQWPAIRAGNVKPMPQLTYHRIRDKDAYAHLLEKGWDTPIKDILGKAK
jgi:methionyl-tRNA formyltransferase